MIKQEIIEKISKYFRLTQFEAEKVFDDIFSFIIQGVKEDNIVDVANFGEFIIKYDNERNSGEGNQINNHFRKTVEFLAASSLEEELNAREKFVPGNLVPEEKSSEEPLSFEDATGKGSVEDELRRKREALLSKISIHPLQDAKEEEIKPKVESPVTLPPPPPALEIIEGKKEISTPETGIGEPIEPIKNEPVAQVPGVEMKTAVSDRMEEPSEFEDDISNKSFSDYFAEVGEAGSSKGETVYAPEEFTGDDSSQAGVLPKTAIDLHNEITGAGKETLTSEPPKMPAEKLYEDKSEDKSYYIWYKDSESSPTETQNLSYEYELLYQATKEAEYKSKLKIYVSTFILFFSIVLLLLIFSPVIYKVFFTPIEFQSIENLREEAGFDQSSFEQEAFKNPKQETTPQNLNQTPPAADTITKSEIPTVTQQKPEEQKKIQLPVTEQKQEQTPVTEEPKIEGVTPNAMGWTDDKFKVIYVRLVNGKYAIQESSWDSEAKANKRLSLIDSYKISGLKGNITKVEVSGKGSWYRVRLGEFSTFHEARKKTEELRNKVKS